MSFKIKSPYNKETLNTSVFNYPDEPGTFGRTNMNLSILINKDVKDPAKREEVYNHELGHKHQIEEGRLAYDDENVYYDKNGDGNMETHPRSKMDEGDSALAWESEVYNEQNNKPMTKFKLREGSGNPAPFANLSDRGLITPDSALAKRKPKKWQKGGDLFSATVVQPEKLDDYKEEQDIVRRRTTTNYPEPAIIGKIDPEKITSPTEILSEETKTKHVKDDPITRKVSPRITTVYREQEDVAPNERFPEGVYTARPVVQVESQTYMPGQNEGKEIRITKYDKTGISKTKEYTGKKYEKGVRKGARLTAEKYIKRSGQKKKRFAKARVSGRSGVTPTGQKILAQKYSNVDFGDEG